MAKKGDRNEKDFASGRGDRRAFGVRHNTAAAGNANLPGRVTGCSRNAVSDASASATTAADRLPERHHGSGWHGLPDAASAAPSASASPRARW